MATGKGLGPVGLKRVRSVDFSRGAGWTQHSQGTKSYRMAREPGVGSGGGDYEALVWPEQAVWEARQQNLTLGKQKQQRLPDGDGAWLPPQLQRPGFQSFPACGGVTWTRVSGSDGSGAHFVPCLR